MALSDRGLARNESFGYAKHENSRRITSTGCAWLNVVFLEKKHSYMAGWLSLCYQKGTRSKVIYLRIKITLNIYLQCESKN